MTNKKTPKPYDRKNNEATCGYNGDSPVAGMSMEPKTAMSVELEMLYQMYEDVAALKLAVAELKAALASLSGAAKPQGSPASATPPSPDAEPGATLPAGVRDSGTPADAQGDSDPHDGQSQVESPSAVSTHADVGVLIGPSRHDT